MKSKYEVAKRQSTPPITYSFSLNVGLSSLDTFDQELVPEFL
jgi:hypothetical protein